MSNVLPSLLPEQLTEFARFAGPEGVAGAYAVSRWLTRPTPGRPRQTPADYGLSWERCQCHTADGLRLVGWVVTPPRPWATVALFHGLRRGREELLPYLALLAGAGYRGVAFDHRAHGESDGRRTSFGYHEGRDVAAVLDWIGQTWPRQPWAVLGRCLGAAAVCFAAACVRRTQAVILEGLYPDLETVFRNRLRSSAGPPWLQRFGAGVAWITARRLGRELSEVAPVRHIGELAPAPILLVAGTQDESSAFAAQQCLFAACRGPREFHLVAGGGSRDLLAAGGAEYRERLLLFLEYRLSGRVPRNVTVARVA